MKHIAEVHAKQQGIPTIRDQIRADIDNACQGITEFDLFIELLERRGYTLERRGSFLRVRPDGYNKFFRLDKLGYGYSESDIHYKLDVNYYDRNCHLPKPYRPILREKPKGLYALYLHYLYLLGVIPKSIPVNREAYVALKEDVRCARMYNEHTKFLGKYNLNTTDDLLRHEQIVDEQIISTLCKERQALRNKLLWMKDTEKMQPIREEIYAISAKIKPLRKERKMCKDIYDRSSPKRQSNKPEIKVGVQDKKYRS